jgi:hypothetical protein
MEMVVTVELGSAPASAEFRPRGLALGWNSKNRYWSFTIQATVDHETQD